MQKNNCIHRNNDIHTLLLDGCGKGQGQFLVPSPLKILKKLATVIFSLSKNACAKTLFEAYESCTTHGLGVTGNGHPHKNENTACKVGKSACITIHFQIDSMLCSEEHFTIFLCHPYSCRVADSCT